MQLRKKRPDESTQAKPGRGHESTHPLIRTRGGGNHRGERRSAKVRINAIEAELLGAGFALDADSVALEEETVILGSKRW